MKWQIILYHSDGEPGFWLHAFKDFSVSKFSSMYNSYIHQLANAENPFFFPTVLCKNSGKKGLVIYGAQWKYKLLWLLQNTRKNYDNTENSELFTCLWRIYWNHTSNPNTKLETQKLKLVNLNILPKKILLTLASIPKLKKNAAKVFCIQDSETKSQNCSCLFYGWRALSNS